MYTILSKHIKVIEKANGEKRYIPYVVTSDLRYRMLVKKKDLCLTNTYHLSKPQFDEPNEASIDCYSNRAVALEKLNEAVDRWNKDVEVYNSTCVVKVYIETIN